MKKKEVIATNNNIEKRDEELEKLANEFIETAERKGINKTNACKLLSDVWKEKVSSRKIAELKKEEERESEKEKLFREKVKKFLKEYDEMLFENLNEDTRERCKSISLEVIFISYKMFLKEDKITYQTLICFIMKYLQDVPMKRSSLQYNVRRTLDELYIMLSRSFFYKIRGRVMEHYLIDITEKPKYALKGKDIDVNEYAISKQSFEHFRFVNEFEIGHNNKAAEIVLELVWVIETFF